MFPLNIIRVARISSWMPVDATEYGKRSKYDKRFTLICLAFCDSLESNCFRIRRLRRTAWANLSRYILSTSLTDQGCRVSVRDERCWLHDRFCGWKTMITLSEDALAFIEKKNSPLYIDIPHTVSGCCFEITDCPSVRFGEPHKLSDYTKQTTQGVTVFVPNCFPSKDSFVIRTRSFFGFQRLAIDGWRLIWEDKLEIADSRFCLRARRAFPEYIVWASCDNCSTTVSWTALPKNFSKNRWTCVWKNRLGFGFTVNYCLRVVQVCRPQAMILLLSWSFEISSWLG